jgi:membrane associated rhomboid family serine protease
VSAGDADQRLKMWTPVAGVVEVSMNPWTCATLVALAGGLGGVVNALLTDNGFALPRLLHRVWCPGFLANVLVGAFAAFASWAFYGSGAAIDLAHVTEQTQISLRFSALAGAFLVGVVGAKWLTNEADKQLLKASVTAINERQTHVPDSAELVRGSAQQILKRAMCEESG